MFLSKLGMLMVSMRGKGHSSQGQLKQSDNWFAFTRKKEQLFTENSQEEWIFFFNNFVRLSTLYPADLGTFFPRTATTMRYTTSCKI